jgi:hypothetical protein
LAPHCSSSPGRPQRKLGDRARARFFQRLLLDTWHVYDQLQEEFHLHAGKVRKYTVLLATTTYGVYGETPGHRGLGPAVEEFLARGTFRLRERYENCHGLTILQAVPDARPAGDGPAPAGAPAAAAEPAWSRALPLLALLVLDRCPGSRS